MASAGNLLDHSKRLYINHIVYIISPTESCFCLLENHDQAFFLEELQYLHVHSNADITELDVIWQSGSPMCLSACGVLWLFMLPHGCNLDQGHGSNLHVQL